MLIGGYQPCSLCDYPGYVAAVLFTQGCNFRCPFCHNGALLPATAPAASLLAEQDVLERLRRRRGQLGAVVVSGGEPTLHADLPECLARIKALGFVIKLDTNGSHPAMLCALLAAQLVDYVAMDVKAPWEKYDELTGVSAPVEQIQESMALIAKSGLPHEFRTTQVTALLSEEDLRAICRQLPPESPHTMQPFRAAHALDPQLRAAQSFTGATV